MFDTEYFDCKDVIEDIHPPPLAHKALLPYPFNMGPAPDLEKHRNILNLQMNKGCLYDGIVIQMLRDALIGPQAPSRFDLF